MAGINVLSDLPKGGGKLENNASSKGREASDGYENAAAVFAGLLDSKINAYSSSKGQGSLADQDAEEEQDNVSPVQGDQNSKAENALGYGNFVLPFLNQMLQSDLPAGKEANSGETVGQGIEGSVLANPGLNNVSSEASKNLEAAIVNLVSFSSDESLGSTGMMTPSSQGNNLGISELDKYRQVIANLLGALSGTITDSASQDNLLGADNKGATALSQEMAQIIQGWMTMTEDDGEGKSTLPDAAAVNTETNKTANIGTDSNSVETKDFSQELAKIIQAWMTMEDDDTASDLNTSGQNKLQKLIQNLAAGSGNAGSPEQNAKAANLLAALYPLLSKDAGGAKGSQEANEALKNRLKNIGIDLGSITNIRKEVAPQVEVQQRSEGTGLQESKLLKNFHNLLREEVNKADSIKSSDSLGSNNSQTHQAGVGVGAVINVAHLAGADGKISAIPLWEQISTVVREQVMSKQQALKELDIQLHPAELGNIRIFLRWESGQVHLQVHASEAATGQLLQNQLSDLRQNLINQGVDCGSLQMGQGGEGQQQPQGDDAQRTLQQTNLLTNEEEEQISITNPNSLGMDGINQINVTA